MKPPKITSEPRDGVDGEADHNILTVKYPRLVFENARDSGETNQAEMCTGDTKNCMVLYKD